jgi:hypothetical protein
MSTQQKEDIWKWIMRALMSICSVVVFDMYTTSKTQQDTVNTILIEIRGITEAEKNHDKEIDQVKQDVKKLYNDFYKPNN